MVGECSRLTDPNLNTSRIDFSYRGVLSRVITDHQPSQIGPELADWIWNGSWVLNLLGVVMVSGGIKTTGLPEYHLAELSTINSQSYSDC